MSQEYSGGWVTHLADMLWAYRCSTKFATRFSPFSLVYEIEVVIPVELMIPSLRVMQMRKEEKEKMVFVAKRCEDLEGLDERKEEAQEHSCRYMQRMIEAYGRTIKERVFVEGQLVSRIADHVKSGLVGPSKFLPKWEGPFVIREANATGYYCLAQMGKDLINPINGKWLKRYYT